MINEVTIKNFKSVQNTKLKLGRFNVLIGSNGSGKSNILEAIAFGAAASADKLDNEFLGSRGIRISIPKQMKCAFSERLNSNPIEIEFKENQQSINFTIENGNVPLYNWIVKDKEETEKNYIKSFHQKLYSILEKNKKNNDIASIDDKSEKVEMDLLNLENDYIERLILAMKEKNIFDTIPIKKEVDKFIIFAPEESSLRKFETESQIKPLGIKGEGLFDVLQIFNESYGQETIEEIKKYLHLIEWFDDFEAVSDQVTGRKSLVVKDRYLPDARLNQTNVNEGFLYLLFYISLFVSKETPTFFAIDNIEASFHPTLVEELIKNLIELSKKHKKQIIITTHNPFVLDGLNLEDEEQKLFVIRRNADGESIADAITNTSKRIKLSEAWVRGQFGGQPKNIR